MSDLEAPQTPSLTDTLIEFTIDGWRLSRTFQRALEKMDAGESRRYASQLIFFQRKMMEHLQQAGLSLVDLTGQPWDPGMPASPLNIGDFSEDDELIIDTVLEPVIMAPEGIRRTGTVTLRKVNS